MKNFDFSKTPGKERIRFYSPLPEQALVSVVTPYYNAGKYFEQTFNSVMNQTFPWFEWIIVNDGSTNEADVELLKSFAQKDGRIRVVHQKNGGLSCARNTGFANARTELIVPLDADDLIAPQFLECLYWGLFYNPDAAWSYCDSYGFQNQEYIWHHPFNAEQMKKENMLVATAMIRKEAFEEIGGYKVEKWPYNEDWRFWLEMLAAHKRPVHIDTELFWYRRMDTSMLASIKQDPERVRFSEQIIREAASKVDEAVLAVEYPVKKSVHSFYKPIFSECKQFSKPDKKGVRILWMIPWMVMGGADKFNLNAISGLTDRGYENYILTTLSSENEWRQKFEDYTDEIFCMADFLDPVHYIEFVSYYIQSRQIDVLMLTNSYDGYYMIPWIRQHFPELTIVDYVHMEEWYWRAGGHARPSGAMNGLIDRTYVCNSATQQVMIEQFGCKPDSVKCLYIGVDSDYFRREKEKAGYLHNLLNLLDTRPIVLMPCRVHEQKRPFMLLDIADGVRKIMPEVAFVVVGDGPQLEELKHEVKRRELSQNVFCIGSSDDMRACYRDSSLTLICSLKEGLSLTAYESCAMEIPVVSSDVGGQHDLIDSTVGALIPLGQNEEFDLNNRNFSREEVKQYVDCIVKILSNPDMAKQMGKNARCKIERTFSIVKMIEKLDCELQKLCKDTECKNKRNALSRTMQMMPGYAAEYYTLYCQWEKTERESEEIWQSRCWFQSQLGKVYNKNGSKLAYVYKHLIEIPLIGSLIQKTAQWIWNIGR